MKTIIATVMLGVAITTPSFASQDDHFDASQIFQIDNQPMQLVVLSSDEMKTTEGAFLNFSSSGGFSHRGIFGSRSGGWGFDSSLNGFNFSYNFNGSNILGGLQFGRDIGFSLF